jgi:hypothetical protein
MPKTATSHAGLQAWGQVRVENAKEGLVYQSPPEGVALDSRFYPGYERRRCHYCQLTRGVRIPSHYRTGELPPHPMWWELAVITVRYHLRRLRLWLREHHP